MSELVTVYVSIGNSDDRLSQVAWSNFLHSFRGCMAQFAKEVYGNWVSEPSSSFQNACVAIATETPLTLKAALTLLRADYGQNSVAWAEVPRTEFI